MLQPLYGGALARPFMTHHNELERDLYLRIATELYLKRCIIGGIDRVYEIGKDFRNEGVSFKHNPEFTMLETYEAYVDYNHVMTMVEQMTAEAAAAVGGLQVTFREHEIDLTPPWPRLTMRKAIENETGIDIGADDSRTVADLQARIKEKGLEDVVPLAPAWGAQVDELFSECVEPKLIQPVFITEHPLETSPFAKKTPHDPRFVERFEGFIAGMELSNAFSELNDPDDQRERFMQQTAGPRRRRRDRAPARRGLPRGHGARHAAHRRPRHGHRPPGDDPHRRAQHPRRHPLPGAAELASAPATPAVAVAAAAPSRR